MNVDRAEEVAGAKGMPAETPVMDSINAQLKKESSVSQA